jgi:hypothetical protein
MFLFLLRFLLQPADTENRVRLSVLCRTKFKFLGFGSRQRALDLVEEARKRARKKGK